MLARLAVWGAAYAAYVKGAVANPTLWVGRGGGKVVGQSGAWAAGRRARQAGHEGRQGEGRRAVAGINPGRVGGRERWQPADRQNGANNKNCRPKAVVIQEGQCAGLAETSGRTGPPANK